MEFRDERRTCVIVATGPSAGCVNLSLIRGWPAIAVNDGYRIAPQAEILYSGDTPWWDFHFREVAAAFAGEKVTCVQQTAKRYGLRCVGLERAPGLSVTPGVVRTGGQIGFSGAQAVNLAYLEGARRLVLIGFDMGEQGHYFGDHPDPLKTVTPWAAMRAGVAKMAEDLYRLGVEVHNCSPLTSIRFWPRPRLEDVLPV